MNKKLKTQMIKDCLDYDINPTSLSIIYKIKIIIRIIIAIVFSPLIVLVIITSFIIFTDDTHKGLFKKLITGNWEDINI